MKIRNHSDLLALWEVWSFAERDAFAAKETYLNALTHVEEHGFDEHSQDSDCILNEYGLCTICGADHNNACPTCQGRAYLVAGCADPDNDMALQCMGCGGIGHNEGFCNGGAE